MKGDVEHYTFIEEVVQVDPPCIKWAATTFMYYELEAARDLPEAYRNYVTPVPSLHSSIPRRSVSKRPYICARSHHYMVTHVGGVKV